MDAHHALIGAAVLANAATPYTDALELVTRSGPVGLLVIALVWLERERKADRARCDAEHKSRDSDFDAIRAEVAVVRDEGEKRHHECREELERVTARLLGLIGAK